MSSFFFSSLPEHIPSPLPIKRFEIVLGTRTNHFNQNSACVSPPNHCSQAYLCNQVRCNTKAIKIRLLLTSSSFMTPVFTQGKAIALDCKDCRSEVKDNVILFLSPLCKTMLWSFLLLGTPVWVFQVLDRRPVYLKLPFLFSQLLKKGPDVALKNIAQCNCHEKVSDGRWWSLCYSVYVHIYTRFSLVPNVGIFVPCANCSFC